MQVNYFFRIIRSGGSDVSHLDKLMCLFELLDKYKVDGPALMDLFIVWQDFHERLGDLSGSEGTNEAERQQQLIELAEALKTHKTGQKTVRRITLGFGQNSFHITNPALVAGVLRYLDHWPKPQQQPIMRAPGQNTKELKYTFIKGVVEACFEFLSEQGIKDVSVNRKLYFAGLVLAVLGVLPEKRNGSQYEFCPIGNFEPEIITNLKKHKPR